VYAGRWHDRRPLLAHGSLGPLRSQGGSRTAYARQIEIAMRPATFISILRESHLPSSKNDYNSNRPHTSLNEAHPDGARKPPDEAMTNLELLSLPLNVDGLVKAIACNQRFPDARSLAVHDGPPDFLVEEGFGSGRTRGNQACSV
jgi:hypothetical protein